jgi:GNAT superfamily N-acetyltransferase
MRDTRSIPAPSVQPLEPNSTWLTQIAAGQFAYWGPLTGHSSQSSYEQFLQQAARSAALPRVLIASSCGVLQGSVNVMMNEMPIRPQFTPWMGQLFVAASQRSRGIAATLVDAAACYAEQLGYHQLFLFTSGTLPHYYRSRGWIDLEDVTYLGKVRTIMRRDIHVAP